MLPFKFALRSLFCIRGFVLPRYPSNKAWLQGGKKTLCPKFQSRLVRAKERLRAKQKRVPFHEEDAERFKETAYFDLGLYDTFWTSSLPSDKQTLS